MQQVSGLENRMLTGEEAHEKQERYLSTLGFKEIVSGTSSHT